MVWLQLDLLYVALRSGILIGKRESILLYLIIFFHQKGKETDARLHQPPLQGFDNPTGRQLLESSVNPIESSVDTSEPVSEAATVERDAAAVHRGHLDADMVVPLEAIGSLASGELALEGAVRRVELDQDAIAEGLHHLQHPAR